MSKTLSNRLKSLLPPTVRGALALLRYYPREFLLLPLFVPPGSLLTVFNIFYNLNATSPTTQEVRVRGYPHSITLRTGTSDILVFIQMFVIREYRCVARFPAETIIDAGANIGLSAIYLMQRNPTARLVAVESDPENYSLAVKNLAPYGQRCITVPGALWSHSTDLAVRRGGYGDGRHWSSQVAAADSGDTQTVPAYTVPDLLQDRGWSGVDLLKIDIEGAESEVFNGDTTFLDHVRCCVIELHGRKCRDVFYAAAERHGFSCRPHGELTVAERIAARSQSISQTPTGS